MQGQRANERAFGDGDKKRKKKKSIYAHVMVSIKASYNMLRWRELAKNERKEGLEVILSPSNGPFPVIPIENCSILTIVWK